MKKITVLIIICTIILFMGYLFLREGSLPVNKLSKKDVIFVVDRGEPLNSIINGLSKEELIRSRLVFYIIVKQKGIEKKIQAGDFRLSSSMSANEIAVELTHGTLDIWVTIPEGLRKQEIAEILTNKLGVSELEFINKAQEGNLFPDTYLIPKNPTVDQVIELLSSTMQVKYTQALEEAKNSKLSKTEILTLASLVEREASGDEDRQEIANIIYKRYLNDWPLQIDATLQYALGYQPDEKSWWTKNLTQEEYSTIKSPYNTYTNVGLPPTPICNPGEKSIIAVFNANPNTANWYYSHDNKGRVHFAVTLDSHEENTR